MAGLSVVAASFLRREPVRLGRWDPLASPAAAFWHKLDSHDLFYICLLLKAAVGLSVAAAPFLRREPVRLGR